MNRRERVRKHRAAAAAISEQLVELENMTVGELAERYREVFGVPTRTRNKAYLRKKIAWRIQELAEGGPSPRALARIEGLAPQAPVRWRIPLPTGPIAAPTAPAVVVTPPSATNRDSRLPPPGSVLARVHDGVEHRVTVLDEGFEYNGERHKSLSQVARRIAGTSWNGYSFFALQHRKRPAAAVEARG